MAFDVPKSAGTEAQRKELYVKEILRVQPERAGDSNLYYGDVELEYLRLVNDGIIEPGVPDRLKESNIISTIDEQVKKVHVDTVQIGRQSSTVDYNPTGTVVAIDTSTISGIDHHAFPSGLTLRNGKHLIMYSSGTAHAEARTGKRAISTDDGTTWSVSSVPSIIAGIDEFPDGMLLALRLEIINGIQNTRVVTSNDEGVTWTTHALFDVGSTGFTYPNDLIVISKTEALAAVYCFSGGQYYIVILYTSDRGQTWEKRVEVRQNPHTSGYHEPVMVLYPDGELLLFIRSHDGGTNYSLHLSRSFDYGKTFTTPVVVRTNASGRPDAHLTSNGMLVFGYRNTPLAGGPQAWGISNDRGYTWEWRTKFDTITLNPHETYMSWLNLSNGDLGVAYSLENGTQDASTLHFMRFQRESINIPSVAISEDIFLGSAEGELVSGLPAKSVLIGWPVWTLSADAVEQVGFITQIPKAWKRFDVSVVWSQFDPALSGDVSWRHDLEQASIGTTMASAAGVTQVVTAPNQYILAETKMATNILRTGDFIRIKPTRVGNAVADTLTGKVAVVGVRLKRTD